ncbi:PDF receptor-like [Amphibalanus amphitrite]|uniref:PDF receptor-like n=1 Tax=Amphibalanus amphitrite TaxID=1232801 RepID=UPI001C8FFB4A|nr:PDF receptor-like [Amphibalanus amphitrite]
MVGLSVSFCCIIICLFLFCYFRRLRNSRTRIHIHLFTAILVLVVLRLTLYIDQYIIRAGDSNDGNERGIDNTPGLCELFYVLQEWARSATFLWMFLEGYYLHSTLTRDVFNEKPNFVVFSLIGWGLSILLMSVWAIFMAYLYTETQCWWGKHVSRLYWIIQGPRFMVIAANLGFLLNILRVLVTKLHESSSNDVQKVRKAVRAALFLLPLLGITHSLEMFEPPLDRSVAVFGCYTIVLAVLDSFQGFYISLLYCFLNQEVRDAVVKQWHDMSVQRQLGCRRPSHIDRKASCRLLHMHSVRTDAEATVEQTVPTENP